MQELERGAVATDVLSDHCVIFDVMALIRPVKSINLTFDEFADKIREAEIRKSMNDTLCLMFIFQYQSKMLKEVREHLEQQ